MRSTWKTLAAVAASLMVVPQFAAADTDVEAQLQLMQQRMAEMEDRLTAADEQLNAANDRAEEQAVLLERAGLDESMESSSRISNFLEQTDFSGWLAASYFYNFNNPGTTNTSSPSGAGGNTGNLAFPVANFFHPDHNSFQLDEMWFTVDGSANENKKAGFFFEMVYGRSGGVQGNSDGRAGGNDFWIPAAYVEYMASEVATIRAGKFGTYVGYEVPGAANNVNITRGLTYVLFQPIDHVGASLSGNFEGGFDYALAVTNGDFLGDVNQADDKRNKTFMWHVGWGTDTLALSFNGTWGQNEDDNDGYVLDFIGEWTPADNILTWINFDYASGDQLLGTNNYGLAVGGRYGFTDTFGLGGRFEWARPLDDGSGVPDWYSITATTDYEIVENLIWKVEVQWLMAGDNFNAFPKKRTSATDNQVMLGTQLYYAF